MFECLVGYPPFCSDSTHETYQKIVDWPRNLAFPDDIHLSTESEDMIRRYVGTHLTVQPSHIYDRLLTHADRRLIVEQIKKHSFFYGVDWDTIRRIEAPFVPHLRSITDTSYFPTDEIEQVDEEQSALTSENSKDLAFLGCVFIYTWKTYRTQFEQQVYVQTILCVMIQNWSYIVGFWWHYIASFHNI